MSEEKKKPVLDEQTLAKLLEAAYVLQEHNRELRELELSLELKRDRAEAEEKAASSASASSSTQRERKSETPSPATDYTSTLAQIVETQRQIQIRHLDFDQSLSLIAERVLEIGRAAGAAIGIVDGKVVRYRAVAGSRALPAGSEIALEKSLCFPCFRTAQAFRCGDVDPEFLLDTEECRRRGIQSLIAVPIFHDGGVAGALELYYSSPHAFSDQDVHTCQLMAGLVTETIARHGEISSKKSLASERAVMLEALEKLKPNLAALVDKAASKDAISNAPAAESLAYSCEKCGHRLVGEEQYCGQCGAPRGSKVGPQDLHNEIAPLWHTAEQDEQESALPDSLSESSHRIHATNSHPVASEEIPDELDLDADRRGEDEADDSEALALTKRQSEPNWNSALAAREFLEQFADAEQQNALLRFWNARRGDIYLAIAVILVACVVRWGIWSDHSVSATATSPPAAASHHKPDPTSNLSLFDRMLISLGLADEPAPPEDKGNPSTQVWVDLHTGLYYCPGADLFGKTPKGKYTIQREAQLDSFEPAYRKPCE